MFLERMYIFGQHKPVTIDPKACLVTECTIR
jgi:hypothetical protein